MKTKHRSKKFKQQAFQRTKFHAIISINEQDKGQRKTVFLVTLLSTTFAARKRAKDLGKKI